MNALTFIYSNSYKPPYNPAFHLIIYQHVYKATKLCIQKYVVSNVILQLHIRKIYVNGHDRYAGEKKRKLTTEKH